MLVLTRRIDESIIIDNRIVVTVLGIEGDKVKIGVAAPREISILRQELWQAIHDQDRLAEKLADGVSPDTFEELRKLLAEQADQEETDEEDINPEEGDEPRPPKQD
jgi:carbon storage regulator